MKIPALSDFYARWGEPPEEGVVLHKLLNGKSTKLTELQFAVLGLGDSSYPNFCAGKDFDQRFAELGATRLFEWADADLDYSATAEQWIQDIVAIVKRGCAGFTGCAKYC